MRQFNLKRTTRLTGLFAILAIALGAPAAALAQDGGPTSDQYDPPVVQVETSAGGGDDDGSALADPVGPLPFTGFDVIAMLGVALAVTGLGLALQRAVSKQH